ncbi:hypothetical protein FRB96_005558 [Tulasnella sp. 330]|nr:hypothetical protein FRB96_005558 [Tulasnella sp. 330]
MEEDDDLLYLRPRSAAPTPEPTTTNEENTQDPSASSSSSSSAAQPPAPRRQRTRPRPVNPGELGTVPMSPPGGEMHLRPGLPISMAPPPRGSRFPPIPALNLNPPLPSGGVRRDQPPSFNVLERDVTGPPSPTTSSRYPASMEEENSDGERTALIQAMEIACSDNSTHVHLTAEQAMDFCIEQAHKVAADSTEPRSYREAMKRDDKEKWQEAAEKEMKAHMENGTWELVKLPGDRKAIGSRWVFKIKRDAEGNIDRYKARLVAQGFSQRPGQDFHINEIFAPTTHMSSIHAILAIAALNDWEIDSVDISNAYLNGELTEDTSVYMKQPEGFQQGDEVCKLKKGLYGLKQSGRLWYQKLGETLKELGMTRLISNPSIYVWGDDDMKVIIPVHVDDLTITAKSKERVTEIKKAIASKFKIRDLGPISFLLGIAVTRDRPNRTLHLSQRQYCLDLLERFNMTDCKSVTTPMDPGCKFLPDDQPSSPKDIAEMADVPYLNAVGALNYLAIATRPDISYAVHKLARFNSNPGMKHWKAVKHLFRYVQGTKDLKLTYSPDPTSSSPFSTWTDADFAGETTQQKKSTNGYLVKMGTGAISWVSKLQSDIAMSSTEAELYGASFAGREIKWLQSLMSELGFKRDKPSPLFIDNQSTIQVLLDNVSVTRMKHVKTSEYWIRDEVVKHHNISVAYCPTADMPADLLTKALPRQAVEDHRTRMGLQL